MMKKVIGIALVILLAGGYLFYCVNSLNNQERVVYTTKNQVMQVFEDNRDYFDNVAEFYKTTEKKYIFYDLSAGDFVDTDIDDIEKDMVMDIFKKYSFNLLEKDDRTLYIAYHRSFDHKITMGVVYDYESKEWKYTYRHNYDGCPQGHLNGYRIFDMICNKNGG